jgi:hypothetical protein
MHTGRGCGNPHGPSFNLVAPLDFHTVDGLCFYVQQKMPRHIRWDGGHKQHKTKIKQHMCLLDCASLKTSHSSFQYFTTPLPPLPTPMTDSGTGSMLEFVGLIVFVSSV